MNPREFNELAKVLAAGNRPSEFRSAISRAYYAAFHVALEQLESMGFVVAHGPAAHAEVPRLLLNSSDTELVRIGGSLVDFRGARNKADYQLRNTRLESATVAEVHVGNADWIIRELDACGVEPRRSQIIAGINLYLEKLRPPRE